MDSCGPLVRVVNINYGIIGLGFQVAYIFVLTSTSAHLEEIRRVIFSGVLEDGTPRNVSLVGEGPVIESSISYAEAITTFALPASLEMEGSQKGAGRVSAEIWTSETGEPGSATPKGTLAIHWADFDLRDDDTGEIYEMSNWLATMPAQLPGEEQQLIISWAFYLPGQDPFPDLP